MIVSRCNEVASGGRMIDAILTNTMLPEMSFALLERQMNGEEVEQIELATTESGFDYRFHAKVGARTNSPVANETKQVAEPAADLALAK